MTTTRIERTNLRVWAFAIVYYLAVMSIGVWVALATGEWIAIVAALGLVVFRSARSVGALEVIAPPATDLPKIDVSPTVPI